MKLYYRIQNALRDFRRCQRFKRGYSYSDVWNMYDWFMRTVKPMLIHLRDYGFGVPNELYIEGDNGRINWENILNEMINCLEMMDEDNAYAFLGFCELDDYKRMTKEDRENVYRIMEENKNRFFELFSKYFYSLWD